MIKLSLTDGMLTMPMLLDSYDDSINSDSDFEDDDDLPALFGLPAAGLSGNLQQLKHSPLCSFALLSLSGCIHGQLCTGGCAPPAILSKVRRVLTVMFCS